MRCRALYCQVSAILNSETKGSVRTCLPTIQYLIRASKIFSFLRDSETLVPQPGHCWDMNQMCADCQYHENMDDMDTLSWIWIMIIPLQKTKQHLVEKTKNMEMDETPLERLFPWPHINGDVALNAKEGTSIRRNALWASSHGGYSIPPQWTWWKEVSAKHPFTSFLSFLLKSFKVNGWRQFVKRSNVELESTWKSSPFFCHFSHLLDKSKNSRHVWKQNLNELTSHQHQPQHWQTSPHYLPAEFTLATCQVCWFSSPMGGGKKKHVWQDGWISHMTGSCQNICGKARQAIFWTICSWNPKNDR